MVPSGWKIITLGEVVTHKKGFAFKSNSYTSSGTRLIRISDTSRNSIHDNSPVYISNEEAEGLSEHKLSTSDIILSTVGSRPHLLDSMVGKAIQVPSKDDGSLLNQNLVKLIPKKSHITNQYLFAMLKIKKFNHFISTLIRGNANQVSITLKELFEYSFLLPPLLEQQKIAKILTTWDKAINTTERLIENSKQQKKALMQQLLTGQKRLLDDSGQRFSGDWEEKPLQEVFPVIDSLHKTPKFSDVGYPMIRVADIKGGNLSFDNALKVDEAVFNEYTKKYKPKKGDIVFSRVGSYGNSSLVNSDRLFCLGQNTVIASSNQSADSNFIYQFLNTNYIKRQIEKVVDGSSHKTVSLKVIRDLKIKIPLIQEQQKIAAVLTNADREIEVLEQQLADLQQEKKALMQQLLTGKKRVLVD